MFETSSIEILYTNFKALYIVNRKLKILSKSQMLSSYITLECYVVVHRLETHSRHLAGSDQTKSHPFPAA
jgi:hypothetical protein